MRDSWLGLVDAMFCPERPHLERCLRERDHHLAARRLVDEERARAIARCEARIEEARADVFAANDGVVTARMTDLEREWRMLSRRDPDAGLMDLWARIAPGSWIDRKLWRDSEACARLDAAIALASDVEGVEAAVSAAVKLRLVLGLWGTEVGSRIGWRFVTRDSDHVTELLANPLLEAREAVAKGDAETVVLKRASRLERDVHEAACARLPERPQLACGLAHAAYVDCLWRGALSEERPNPVSPLCELWRTGYGIAAVDASGVTLEIPRL